MQPCTHLFHYTVIHAMYVNMNLLIRDKTQAATFYALHLEPAHRLWCLNRLNHATCCCVLSVTLNRFVGTNQTWYGPLVWEYPQYFHYKLLFP
jgi:hypothetical protein